MVDTSHPKKKSLLINQPKYKGNKQCYKPPARSYYIIQLLTHRMTILCGLKTLNAPHKCWLLSATMP